MEDEKLKFGVDLIQIPVLIEVEKPALESIGKEAFMELLFKAVTEIKVDDSKVVWGVIEVDGEKSSIVIKGGFSTVSQTLQWGIKYESKKCCSG